jgi:CRP/FNR family cyclic AMP-dependent transcriptional regulator
MPEPGFDRDEVDLLSLLSDVNRHRFLAGSARGVYPAGTHAFRAGGPHRAFLVEKGLVRVYWSIPNGRQATIAFFHANELLGGVTIMGQPPRGFAQVVVESTLTDLDLETVRSLVATEIEVLRAVATHLATQLRNASKLISVRSMGNIAERVAYDLLERACQAQLAVGRLETRATHADVADSIGSSREVVSRAMKGFRVAGIIDTSPGVIRIVDPVRLAATVRAFVIPELD